MSAVPFIKVLIQRAAKASAAAARKTVQAELAATRQAIKRRVNIRVDQLDEVKKALKRADVRKALRAEKIDLKDEAAISKFLKDNAEIKAERLGSSFGAPGGPDTIRVDFKIGGKTFSTKPFDIRDIPANLPAGASTEKLTKRLAQLEKGGTRKPFGQEFLDRARLRSKEGVLEAGLKKSDAFTREHPFIAAGGAALTFPFLLDLAEGPVEAVTGSEHQKRLDAFSLMARGEASARMRQSRLARDASANIGRLATLRPDIVQAVAAGRPLPRGAVAIGGEPRIDLLEQLGARMAEGAFGMTQEDMIAQAIGG